MNIIIFLVASIICACLYRCGGAAKTGAWYDFLCQTKARDVGVPLCFLISVLCLGIISVFSFASISCLVLSFGLLFGSCTTYWKKKGDEAKWWNWAITGLAYSLSAVPIILITGHWLGFGIRCVALTGLTVLWSQLISNVVWEECGRGFLICITIPLLLI